MKRTIKAFTKKGCLELFSLFFFANVFIFPPGYVIASPLSDLANSLQPGQWAELDTGLTSDFFITENSASNILDYADSAAWDPITNQLFFVGAPHYQRMKFII